MGIFKCFGCGAGGVVFKFVMDVEHVDFPEAVRMLAEEAGIELPDDDDDAGRAASSEAETLEHALRLSARFFYRRLTDSKEGEAAPEYVLGRGMSRSPMQQFGIGYAPDSWDALLKHAEAEQVNPAVLERAGLVIPRKERDRKSTRLNSSHVASSYAVFCLKKKKLTKSGYLASQVATFVLD